MNSIPWPSDDEHAGAAVGRSGTEGARAPQSLNAGFGAPGADATVKRIDLNDALVRHPQATFVLRARGRAMEAAGIGDGDVLVVDRAVTPTPGHVVIAVVDGDLVCRRLARRGAALGLEAANGLDLAPARDDVPLEIWGVVTAAIKSLV